VRGGRPEESGKIMKTLTPAMLTVLSEAPDEWERSYANANTVLALEARGLIEADIRGRYGTDLYLRRTDAGRAYLSASSP
jgi:hypothetical protein